MFRFIHAADIHLDSPLRGLERYQSAPVEEVRSAPRRAFENLIQLAIDERVAFVLLAGDLYDGDWKDYNTGLFFVRQMRRLADEGISVHVIAGNHDAASQITKRLALPENVTLYDSKQPQTVELEALGVAIHGQSFGKRVEKKDLAEGYPDGVKGRLDIGLLHTSIDGRPGHDPYAPTSLATLKSKQYDYWALGHVHKTEFVCEQPWVVFPGNLQGRHARELGPKGAVLVEVNEGEITSVEHRALDVVRWERCEVEVPETASAEDTIHLVRKRIETESERAGRLLALRLVLAGRSQAHAALMRDPVHWTHEYRASAIAQRGDGVFLERVLFETAPCVDLEAALTREDSVGDLMRRVARTAESEADLEAISGVISDLTAKLPRELVSDDAGLLGFDPNDPAQIRALMPAVRALLLSRLAEESAVGDVGTAGDEGPR